VRVCVCSCRWRTYLQPGVMHASSVPFSAWEKAVVKEVCRGITSSYLLRGFCRQLAAAHANRLLAIGQQHMPAALHCI
jgi:hypothetical protein